MADKAWKRNERQIAEYIGGKRVPITGRQRGDAADIDHEWLSVEAKLRQSIPNWILDGMDQAEASQKDSGYLPVLVLREKGQNVGEALICMRLKDFRNWYL